MAPSWRRITRFVPDVLYTITNGASMYLHTIATRLKRGAEVEISNQAKRARVHDLDSNDQELCIEPKHKIFLSHSGAQKNFVEQLCTDLERVNYSPFFDKRSDSLPKGETFPALIIKAAKQCYAAILVLSEEFFIRSKWPMIELNAFVEARASINPSLKILPLFFGISVNEFKDAKRRKRWLKVWQDWADKDDRIDVRKWVLALEALNPINGMEYDAGVGEVNFREKVKEVICKLVPPDLKWDVPQVLDMPRLCEPIMRRISEIEPIREYNIQVLGLHGFGGMGKTTLSKQICNQMYGDFVGKVCHVEFGSKSTEDLLRQVLSELTEASPEILMKEAGKLRALLKSRMKQHKVFLVLDNVLDENIEEAKMYLDAGYQSGSRVLVTSRSLDVLNSLKIRGINCLEIPKLEEKDAMELFLYYATDNRKHDRWKIIRRFVESCKFFDGDTHQYNPLVLEILGAQLGIKSEEPLEWEESLNIDNFNIFRDWDHPIFSVLRTSYDSLSPTDQLIFMDLALNLPPDMMHVDNIVEWLSMVHDMSRNAILHTLNHLRRRGLIVEVESNQHMIYVHDLYKEFAQLEAKGKLNEHKAFKDRRILLYDLNRTDIPPELEEHPSGSCWADPQRLAIHKSEVRKLDLQFLPNLKVASFRDILNIDHVSLEGLSSLHSLKSLEVTNCNLNWEEVIGEPSLSTSLRSLKVNMVRKLPESISQLTALECLDLSSYWCDRNCPDLELLDPPNFMGLAKLRQLTLSGFRDLASFPNLSNSSTLQSIDLSNCSEASGSLDLSMLTDLLRIDLSHCEKAISVIGLSSLTNLTDMNLFGCQLVEELPGLCGVTALQKLNIAMTGIFELPDLRKLCRLQNLSVWKCHNLNSFAGLKDVTSLQRLDASECENLREVPDFSGMKELEMLDLSRSGVSGLPHDLKASNVNGLGSATKLKHLLLGGSGFTVEDLQDSYQLTALLSLNIGGTKICQLPNLRVSWQLQDLILGSCDYVTSLVVLNHATSLRLLDASRCRNLRELPDFGNLLELKTCDLSWSGVYALPNEFERLSRDRILILKGCQGLIEPLVLLLKEHRQQQSRKRSRGCDSIGSSSSVRASDQCRNYMSDIAYYLGEVFLPVLRSDDKMMLLPYAHIVGKMKGGVESVIRALCDHEDMGNLSLVLAAVAGTGEYWPELTARSTIQPLAHRIVQFLKQRIKTLSSSLLERAAVILAHLTDNKAMAGALAGEGICTQVHYCLQALKDYNMDSEGTSPAYGAFEAILERCKSTGMCHCQLMVSWLGRLKESSPVRRYVCENLVVEDSSSAGDALKVRKARHEAGFTVAPREKHELGEDLEAVVMKLT